MKIVFATVSCNLQISNRKIVLNSIKDRFHHEAIQRTNVVDSIERLYILLQISIDRRKKFDSLIEQISFEIAPNDVPYTTSLQITSLILSSRILMEKMKMS